MKKRMPFFAPCCLLALALLGSGGCELNRPSPPLTQARRVFDPRYNDWNAILAHYVTPAGVNYAGLQHDNKIGLLSIALEEMVQVTPDQFENWSREAKLAFLINAHNAHAMMRVLRAYPVKSLGGTTGLFNSARGVRNIRLLGREWSLEALADEITGYPYHESRALFLLNWGARGCPPLPGVAVTAQNLQNLIERQTRDFLGNPANYEYNYKKHILYISKLFKWYRDPVERDYTTLWNFIKRYLPSKVRESAFPSGQEPRLRYLSWDKSLNDAATATPAAAAPAAAATPVLTAPPAPAPTAVPAPK